MPVGLSALRSELLSDPGNFGYAAMVEAGQYGTLTLQLNSVSFNSGLAGVASTITVGTVFALQMQQCVDASNYASLAAVQRDLWNAIITTATTGIAISNTVIRGQILAVWGPGTETRANLAALQTRQASRTEVLFGERVFATTDEVSKACQGDF